MAAEDSGNAPDIAAVLGCWLVVFADQTDSEHFAPFASRAHTPPCRAAAFARPSAPRPLLIDGNFFCAGLNPLYHAGTMQSECRAGACRRAGTRVDHGPATSADPTDQFGRDRLARTGTVNCLGADQEGWREATGWVRVSRGPNCSSPAKKKALRMERLNGGIWKSRPTTGRNVRGAPVPPYGRSVDPIR